MAKWFKINPIKALLIIFLMICCQVLDVAGTYLLTPQANAVFKGEFLLYGVLLACQLIINTEHTIFDKLSVYLFDKQTQFLFHRSRATLLKHFILNKEIEVSECENVLTNDIEILENDYFKNFYNLLTDLFYLIMIIGTLFSFHWILVFYSIIVSLLSLAVTKVFLKSNKLAIKLIENKNNSFYTLLKNWVRGLKELRRYSGEKIFSKVINNKSVELKNVQIRQQKTLTISQLCQSIIDVLGRIGIPLISGILYFKGEIQIGMVISAGYFSNGIFNTLMDIINNLTVITSTKTLRNKILYKNYDITLINKCKRQEIKKITLHDVSAKFGNGKTIKYPNFVVHQNDKVLLTGKSGMGKSTLLKLILGLIELENGEISFENLDGNKVEANFQIIDYLKQSGTLFPGTILENITMFKNFSYERIRQAIVESDLMQDINNFSAGLDEVIDPENNTLSGGQKQKIILARSLFIEKPVLLLDEPLSAVDKKGMELILNNILSRHQIVIMVAHNLSVQQKYKFNYEINLDEGKKYDYKRIDKI